jgi:uncharacterized phage protein (TIGR01671 family)
MQREIKFRAWDKNKGTMVHVGDGGRWSGSVGLLMDGFEDEDLMQFTGLLDKNGKHEIYEGDVLEVEQDEGTNEYPNWVKRRDKVEFSGGCFFGIFNEPLYALVKSDGFVDAVVIGNVFENPELIANK